MKSSISHHPPKKYIEIHWNLQSWWYPFPNQQDKILSSHFFCGGDPHQNYKRNLHIALVFWLGISTLPETNGLGLKMDGWNTFSFPSVWAHFQVENSLWVSGRVHHEATNPFGAQGACNWTTDYANARNHCRSSQIPNDTIHTYKTSNRGFESNPF